MKNILLIAMAFIAACSPSKKATVNSQPSQGNYVIGGKVFTSLYQQKAAEYRALCLQAYNIAALRISHYSGISAKPKAIVTDIDETILDNSPYAVHRGLEGKDYDVNTWYEWTARAEADTMPGAAMLLNYARSKGIDIFYITNRDLRERDATIRNLQRFNLPNADTNHVIMRQGTSSKEARRQKVLQTHEIVLLMGDNLADFSSLFDKKTVEERKTNTDMSAADFGNRFIVFPNPDYGDWESSIFKYNYNLTPAQKDSVIRSVLKNY
ncbi:5'-nucleotidase, lipoprotein e(P4) family [Ferruginibacter sp. HRS2-29]|uniref:5'-nucleotidase, lipoprotein e(P4) family n=1 Tax=Ferruginibacter sp. HRS2-29 TaxID=2487334 RepID=UPI0020CD0700|nr:5'-nucleotidase, lipoprotein e(P4) family [Ferruginibacter sp. HRS2-29]MCP9753372.1 5'-nucleotidase, lipoprotein e(P4) family [Ferruginibacter sp. HRS2-29]